MLQTPNCHKRTYPTERSANKRIKELSTSKRRKKPTRSYQCLFCKGWHITSRRNFGAQDDQ